MPTSTKIEVYDPNMDKPVTRIIVPGDITKDQLKKEIKVGVTLIIDLGDKKKKKTFTIKIFDEALKQQLEDYINSLIVKLSVLETEERVGGEITLADIKTD